MSVKRVLSRGLELGRSVLQLGLPRSAGRLAAKLRPEYLRGGQPQSSLPPRYRYYRVSLRGLAARLQAAGLGRLAGGSARSRAAFLAFGVGLGLVEEQLEGDRRSAAACREIQALFSKKKFQTFPEQPLVSGYKLEDYVIGKQIGKGCNAAVYEAAAPAPVPPDQWTGAFPLAVKMMWNIGAGSSSETILRSMSQELVPAGPQAMRQEAGALTLHGHFGRLPETVSHHPNVITVHRAFTAEVPLLPGAEEEYPDVLPARLHPRGVGNNRTLFLVMKNYPRTLRHHLEASAPSRRDGTLMLLQLLEGVDHLCKQGVAHRDLKSDNVLLELDSGGRPRLVITDFGCCLAERDRGLQLPFSSWWVDRGGNSCLMAPEVAAAVPGPGVVIDYSKADAWAVGAMAYELFGQKNPFYGPCGLEGRSYQEKQLPALPSNVPADVRLVVRLLLRRNPNKRPSARVAANILHLSLWGGRALARLDRAAAGKMADWLLCESARVLLKGVGRSRALVEEEQRRCFLANVDLEDLRTAAGFLLYGRAQRSGLSQ
ncbi:serine/threonine-protein kinase PINK1, mitochondrial-like [Denticeps clupeoides]|uniref:Serine/threonine-protein kinase PINK1, mitochondrial n=1 Tax=Denticeps clupeoides TaxID=299321 RepID=A0AAY4CZ41_9TELE|nr:serine/threonine-protein kinase PINK1, mitochondrial-like [Denticeps clupeoides]